VAVPRAHYAVGCADNAIINDAFGKYFYASLLLNQAHCGRVVFAEGEKLSKQII
jgi:hypothetical protein